MCQNTFANNNYLHFKITLSHSNINFIPKVSVDPNPESKARFRLWFFIPLPTKNCGYSQWVLPVYTFEYWYKNCEEKITVIMVTMFVIVTDFHTEIFTEPPLIEILHDPMRPKNISTSNFMTFSQAMTWLFQGKRADKFNPVQEISLWTPCWNFLMINFDRINV